MIVFMLFRHSKYWLPWLVGMPAETATAICSLLMGGILYQFPKLKVERRSASNLESKEM